MMPKHSVIARHARHVTALLAVSLLTVAACSDSGGGVSGGTNVVVVAIVPIPNSATLVELIPGNTRQMLGVPTNSADNWVDKPVTWASSNAAVVSVDATTGLVTAVAGGSAFIRATAGGKTDSIAVAVRYPVGTINLTPATTALLREQTVQLVATTLDTQGATVTGRTVTWTSSNTAAATVSATGLVSATQLLANEGATTITATAANASDGGTATIQTRVITVAGNPVVSSITIAGATGFHGNSGTDQLTATALSGLGNTIVTPITWSTNAAGQATVDGNGLVTFAGGIGAVTITATAVGAGLGGADVVANRAFFTAATVTAGTYAVPTMAAGTGYEVAFLATGGVDLTVTSTGGSGDGDLYLFNPANLTGTADDDGGSGFLCRSWNGGNVESCPIAGDAVVSGWYRIRTHAWTPAGDVTGMMVTIAHP